RAFMMISHGHLIENSLYWNGIHGCDHEAECMVPWLHLARSARGVLDIGANTGFYALAAACVAPEAEVHAFEPVARIAGMLRLNCEANPGLRITVHEA